MIFADPELLWSAAREQPGSSTVEPRDGIVPISRQAAPPAPQPRHAPSRRRPVRTEGALSILMATDVDPLSVTSGAERILNEHSRRLAARGHRVTVLTRREDDNLPPVEEIAGVRIYRHEFRLGRDTRAFASVLREGARAYHRLAVEECFDVLNAHQPLAACALLKGAGVVRPPLIYSFHSTGSQEYAVHNSRTKVAPRLRRSSVGGLARQICSTVHPGVRRYLEQAALSRSQRVLALSRFSAEQLEAIHGIELETVDIIPGGVDTERFRPVRDRVALRRRLGLPTDRPILLIICNLEARMGLENLIEAVHILRATRPDVCLVIGGAGALQDALRLQVEAHGLQGNVRFAGVLPEAVLPGYYAAADLFVLPTRCLEGFGLITVEALACGTPVVGTPVGAIPEVLRPLDPGLLFAGTGPAEMAGWFCRRLPTLLGNGTLREQCRTFAARHYAWESIMLQIELLFYEAAGASVGEDPVPAETRLGHPFSEV
jgi:glycosyltransferase involved in cell wall biosynthesis